MVARVTEVAPSRSSLPRKCQHRQTWTRDQLNKSPPRQVCSHPWTRRCLDMPARTRARLMRVLTWLVKPRLFHPHISRAARHLQRPAGHVEALTQYQMNERAARLRQAEADKEKLPSECTFAPRINSNSKKLARLHRVKEEAKVRARACGAAGWPCPRHAHAQLTVGCLRFEMGGLCPSVPKMVRRPQLRRRRHSHGTRAIRRWASPRMSGCTRRRSSCRPRG